MKKILFVISLIATLLLVGCNQNKNKPTENMQQEITETNNPTLENNDEIISNGNSENTDETINVDTLENEEVIKYKLSDDISLAYDMKEDSLYNLYNEKPLVDSYEININEKTHTISTKNKGNSKVALFIDGNEITSVIDDEYFSKRTTTAVGVIHIEDKPFIVIRWWEGSIAGDNLYSINNNLELKFEKGFEELYKVGDKYIAPNFFKETDFDHIREGIVISYLYYENNEWKYINRSINGKELIDENGKFSEELYIEGEGFYSLGMDYSGFFTHKDESDISLLTSSKYKVIKQYPDLHVYDIEMLEDSTWGIALDVDFEKFDSDGNWTGETENEEHISAGSIVEKVKIHSLKQI